LKTKGFAWWNVKLERYNPDLGRREVIKQIDDEELIDVANNLPENPAMANTKLGVTLNLDNYESLRVDVGVTIPCNVEDVEAVQNNSYEFCERKIIEFGTRFRDQLR
jgi:hypothetical protein